MARTDPRPFYGRKRRERPDGYVDVYEPGHPLARRDGYVFEHRKVAWDAGLLADPALQIHHLDGDRANNALENLAVVTAAEHARLHAPERTPASCPQGHEYTEANTAFDRSGWRYCKQCNRDRARRNKLALIGAGC